MENGNSLTSYYEHYDLATVITLVVKSGFSRKEAKEIYDNYHELYKVSDAWIESKIEEASRRGYAELAFGLKLRCPIVKQTILGTKTTPTIAEAEKRTIANAMGGQSYGLLNSRACVEFQERCLNSKYKLDIKPCAQIHDASYYLIRNNYETLKWFNDNLVECIEWQNLPELQQVPVKITGNTGIFYPTWANEIELKHNLDYEGIREAITKGINKYYNKEK